MSSIYLKLQQANDKFAAMQSIASSAATQFQAGALSHGQGAILEVALIASAIRLNYLTYHNGTRQDTFGVNQAVAASRIWYDRYVKEHGEGEELFPFGADGKGLNAWRNRVLMMLHPYTYNGHVYDWQKTNKQVVSDVEPLILAKYGKKSERDLAMGKLTDELDATDKVREAARVMFKHACLYVAVDNTGELLGKSDTTVGNKGFGLRFKVGHFIPYKHASVGDVTDEVLLTPVDKRSGALHYFKRTATGTQGNFQSVRVSLASFAQAWTLPEEKSKGTDWSKHFDYIETNLRATTELQPDDMIAFRNAYNRMLEFQAAIDKATKRDTSKPETREDTRTAHDIGTDPTVTLKAS